MKKIHLLKRHQSSHNRTTRQHQFFYLILAIIALIFFVLPRFIHLGADPRSGFIPRDNGYQIDEGYKTFSAKNLLVFGKTIWHPSDTYNGWMKKSPFTQWSYYYAFKNLGLELKNARLISAIYFALFMALAFYFLNRRYGITLALTGTLLLASEPALFHFSRSALFETALILFLYAGILLTTRIHPDKPLKVVTLMVVLMFIALFTVKKTAIIYFFPPIAACFFLVAFNMENRNWSMKWSWRNTIYITAILLIIISPLIYGMRDLLFAYVNIDHILKSPVVILLTPMSELAPLALLLGYSCILHLLLVKPKCLFDNIYRLSLVSIIVVGVILLSMIGKHPARFFVPIIPACLLLTIEWFYLKPWELRMQESFSKLQRFTIAFFFIMFFMFLLRAFDFLILGYPPFITLSDLQYKETLVIITMLVKPLSFFLIAAFAVYYMVRSNAATILGYLIPILVLTSIIVGFSAQAMTLLHPSYDSQTIRTAINGMVTDTQSIAGGWAPFFTAEVPIRSFYMNDVTNFPYPEHLDKIRPDYFLFDNTRNSNISLEFLESNDQIKLSEPQMIGTYMNHDIYIYRIKYPIEND